MHRIARVVRVGRMSRIGGAGLFLPLSLPGLLLWLDPSFGRFQETTGPSATTPASANNDPVGTWLAQTGQYFTAPAAGQRPLLQIGVNGRPFLLGDGVDDFLTRSAGTAAPAMAEPMTILGNVKPDLAGGTAYCMIVGQVGVGGGAKNAILPGSGNVQICGRDAVDNWSVTSATGLTTNVWTRIGSTWASPAGVGQGTYRFNGAADGTATTAAVGVTGNPRIFASQGGGELFKGGIGDVLVYNRVLAAAELAALDAWMLSRTPT